VTAEGDAGSYGAPSELNAPLAGIVATADGRGYWLVAADGGCSPTGNAAFEGSLGNTAPAHLVMAIAATPSGHGYWLVNSGIGPTPPEVTQVLGDCTDPEAEPSSFVLACADHNSYLAGVTWSSWTRSVAVGTGTYWQNDCTPDCAHGRFVSSPGATIELSRPVATSAGVEFTTVTVSYVNPTAPGTPQSYSVGGTPARPEAGPKWCRSHPTRRCRTVSEPIPDPFPTGPWRWEDLRWRDRIADDSTQLVREAVRRAVDLRDWSEGTGLTSRAVFLVEVLDVLCVALGIDTADVWVR